VSVLDLPVAGIINAGVKDMDSKFLFMPLEQAQSLAHTQDVTFLSVLLKESKQAKVFSEKLNQVVHEKGLALHASDWRDHKQIGAVYRKSMGFLNIFRNFFIIVVLTIAILSVLNTLLKIVKERTREIGTWRSLGYTKKQLKIIFAFEAASLGLLGCFLGTLFSLGFSEIINVLQITYRAGLLSQPVPFSISIVPSDYLFSVLILTGLCVLTSLLAIRNVFKSKICENLIYV
jgi:ABC-type lipoprotein release transport system permease subunit